MQAYGPACKLMDISAQNWGSEADLHVCPERILTLGEAKVEWQESG